MNIQMRLDERTDQIVSLVCINDDIKQYSNCGVIMVWGWRLLFIMFLWVYLICKISINIHEYAN